MHRKLSYQLGLTVGTVSRTYAQPTAQGLIDGQIGRGTFVAKRPASGFAEAPTTPLAPDGIDFGFQ